MEWCGPRQKCCDGKPGQNWLIKQIWAIGKPVSWRLQQETKLLSYFWDSNRTGIKAGSVKTTEIGL